MWDLHGRQVVLAGERGGRKFDDVLVPKPFARARLAPARPNTSSLLAAAEALTRRNA